MHLAVVRHQNQFKRRFHVSMSTFADRVFTALSEAGMPEIPGQFSVVPYPHIIPRATLVEIDGFIRTFDRVTTAPNWQKNVTAAAPEIARQPRSEVCFFSAWDFHLSPEQGWQLIECNDNGSGFFFAELINRLFYEIAGLGDNATLAPPLTVAAFTALVTTMVEKEAKTFFGAFPSGLFLILEGVELLRQGKFRHELFLLRDLFRQNQWNAEIASPEELQWDGARLLCRGQEVVFIVNRSTDFFWQAQVFSPLRAAYQAGRVYVAPNPFTYATRSDKRLLEFLSLPDWDAELGILPEERTVLSAHVPATYLLRSDNIEEIARRKAEFFFKPLHGFAGRGVLTSGQVGQSRLRRLLKKGEGYVAQKRVPKPRLGAPGLSDRVELWTDLRVWAYRGERFLLSGRASCQADLLDLTPPGGWLPTYAQA